MALSKAEISLSESRQADRETRLRAAPSPRLLPHDVREYLERCGGAHALTRIKRENDLVDELLAEESLLSERLFKLFEIEAELRVKEDEGRRYLEVGTSAPSETTKERIRAGLADCTD